VCDGVERREMRFQGINLWLVVIGGMIGWVVCCSPKHSKLSEELSPQVSGENFSSVPGNLERYWTRFSVRDSSRLQDPKQGEMLFSRFVILSRKQGKEQRKRVWGTFVRHFSSHRVLFQLACGWAEKYLYEPDSPLRNDELYVDFLSLALASSVGDEAFRERARFQKELLLKNREGMPAEDFSYLASDGKKNRLYTTSGERLLLFFHDPDCSICQQERKWMAGHPAIQAAVKRKELVVLTIYPDSLKEIWLKSVKEFPAEWINGYEEGAIRHQCSYDLRALPAWYLLDAKKRVLLKDVSPDSIVRYLESRLSSKN